jgi:fused signal recognition particle receptor
MTGNEILIVLALLGLGAVVLLVLRSRAKALPPAPAAKGLGEGKRRELGEPAAEPAPRPATKKAPREEIARPEVAEAAPSEGEGEGERPSEGRAPAAQREEATSAEPPAGTADHGKGPDSSPPSDATTANASPEASPQAPPAAVQPRKPFFTPPPLPGQRTATPLATKATTEPPATTKPAPARATTPGLGQTPGLTQPAARLAVPLPVDKPKAATAPDPSEAARREQERERYRQGLSKTRGGFVAKLARLFKSKPKVDAELRDRIEEVLFTADIGTPTAEKLQARVTKVLDAKDVADPDAVWSVIRQAMLELLEVEAPAPDYAPEPGPYVLLMIGVNGVGKTTTLGKLAAQHTRAGRKVLLVAGDTFRAAAVEQLDVWARRVGCPLHTGADKADPSSVIFEGISRGRREGFDVVLCDTAGRLHTRKELMDELAKVGRAAAKAIAKGQPDERAAEIVGAHDTYLVLDATIGQNALAQAQLFKETMGFTGLVVTKLDGTAKGGVVLGICDELRIPIRYVGIGEGIDDLQAFDAKDFTDALLADRDRPGDEAEADRAPST